MLDSYRGDTFALLASLRLVGLALALYPTDALQINALEVLALQYLVSRVEVLALQYLVSRVALNLPFGVDLARLVHACRPR